MIKETKETEIKEEKTTEVVEVKPVGTVKVEETIVAPVFNTTENIANPNKQKSNAQLAEEVKAAKKKFGKEKLVTVAIPSALQGQLGDTQFVSVNGVYVNVPVDGEDHAIPETLANVLKEMLKNLK